MVYPYHRVFWLVVRGLGRRRESLDPLAEFEWTMRPGIGDIDLYPEVNNGRHFVLFDLARYDLAIRLGLFRWVRRAKAAFVVGGSSIRYRHRLRPWRKVTVRTRLVGIDDRFFYFEQRCLQHQRTCSSAIVRTGVRRRGVIPPVDVMAALGVQVVPFMEPWVEAWNTWDDARTNQA